MPLFGPKDPPRQVVDVSLEDYAALCRKIGRLEAEVQSLQLVWENYRDQINKLTQRVVRRLDRARADETAVDKDEPTPQVDAVTARILARRNRHAVSRDGNSQ